MPDSNLISLILFFPFLAFVVCQFFGKKNQNFAGYFFCLFVLISLLLSFLLFTNNYEIPQKSLNYQWFKVSNYELNLSFLLDKYTYKMLILVNFISLMVGIFSIAYLEHDNKKHRYFGFIGLFLFAMIGIVISGNLFQMYFFWELVGFSSYLLIGFWFTKPEAIEASKKAFLINRIGDISFLIGIFLLFNQLGNTDIINLGFSETSIDNQTIIGLLLFGGCMAKSAQFPLHTWLPDAMEGPTPISALIHAATMVAAGIYLIIRVFPIFTTTALIVISIIGCITMLLGGFKAIIQNDIKKVLAYSTISQLGLMVLAVGASTPDFAFNHLLTHAFFKAGLFLSVGSVIYSIHNSNITIDGQNMFLMGGIRKKLPITFVCYLFCAAAMIGLPLFSGYVSKDQIIETWQHKTGIFSQSIFVCLLISALLSAIYMMRQTWLVFIKKANETSIHLTKLNENSIYIKIPIIVLALFSTFIIIPILEIPFPKINFIAILSTSVALAGLIIAYLNRNLSFNFSNKSIVDSISNSLIVQNTISISERAKFLDSKIFDGATKLLTFSMLSMSSIASWFDKYLIDRFVNFIAKTMQIIGSRFSKLQSGQFQWYISALVLLVLAIFVLV